MNETDRDEQTASGNDARAETWQSALQRYFNRLTADESAEMRAGAVRSLDRATRARRLQMGEIGRLSALADYLTPRIEKREGPPPTITEGVFMGLMAGYQLAVGESAPQDPDPFDD